MKSSEVTIDNALWWDKQMLLKEMEKSEWRGSMCSRAVLNAMNSAYTTYCEDAPAMAMTDYLCKKQCDIDGPFKAVMKVRTKEGKGFMYSVTITEINFATKDMVDLLQELVRPTALRMVRQAAKELKFEDIAYVTAYVVDDSLEEFDQEQHRAAAEIRGCR